MGFEPFLEYDENPSELIVRGLHGRTIEGERVTGVILPVDYAKVEGAILGAIEGASPRLVIGFGLAQGRERVTPEKIAVNCRFAGSADNAGRKMEGQAIDPSQPDGIFASIPVEGLIKSLNSIGVPASLSFSAGAYLCNNAMFIIAREARRRHFAGGFVHVPCHSEWVSKMNKNIPSLPLSLLQKAAEHCVSYSLRPQHMTD